MTELNHLIEIVHDPKKRKMRARSIQDGRWVRFPNNLRKENVVYESTSMTKGRGDSWVAGGKIAEFSITNEKNIVLEKMLDIKNKAVLKQFYENLYDEKTKKVNTEMLNIIFLLKKIFPNVDEQLIQPLIKKYTHSAFISSDNLIPLQNMLQIYNEKRVVSIFSNYEQDDFLEDTVIMYQRLFENDIEVSKIMPEKPKSIRDLHTIFMRDCGKIKVPKNQLKQVLPQLLGKSVGGLSIFIPETTHDLIGIGNPLSICVGNGYYGEKVLKKQCCIIALKDGDKYVYCIEFNKGKIIQARGYRNKDMPYSLKSAFLNLLNEKQEAA